MLLRTQSRSPQAFSHFIRKKCLTWQLAASRAIPWRSRRCGIQDQEINGPDAIRLRAAATSGWRQLERRAARSASSRRPEPPWRTTLAMAATVEPGDEVLVEHPDLRTPGERVAVPGRHRPLF